MWIQKNIAIEKKQKGFHLITDQLIDQIPEINKLNIGLLHVFILHTSASITLNENMDSSVRDDFESFFNHLVPEDQNYFRHTYEGSDDMPAHLKSSILGSSILIPIANGRLKLGTWQGIYLCEHRRNAGPREIMLTIYGEKKN
ncbi:secondary thiamine-phosphate synthase enzyme YjbQ [Candidatus Marinimicrobia bacterium]|nr:secondary thiamine-phosphate synthase enzyme YjbQ [Candidatus Neomarinimicrobiota bacterium]